MRYLTLSSLAVGISVAASLFTPTAAPAGAASSAAPESVKWELCRDAAEDWNRNDERSECAFVPVPVDYSKPKGRQINIAVSRVKATGKRKGALFSNPGGPGLAGTPSPYGLLDSQLAPMNDEFDFIGIDTRGTGYSAQVSCDTPESKQGETEKEAFERYADERRKCIAKDRALTLSISMENASRDMDRVREVLGFHKINFYGNSGGTALGAVYRSMFDNRVDRMWLDSIMSPIGENAAITAEAAQYHAGYRRFFEWLAGKDATYHFGNSPQEVESTLKAMQTKFGREEFTPLLDPNFEAIPDRWERSAAKLMELQKSGAEGSYKPKEVNRSAFGFGEMGHNYVITHDAFMCNASADGREYSDLLRLRKERQEKYPFSADWNDQSIAYCAGWPAGKSWDLKPGKSELQLSGHKFEYVTPYVWAKMMQKKIGGSLLTVMDATHSTMKSNELACGSKVVDFFRNGTTANSSCPGFPADQTGPPGPAGNLAGTVKLQDCSASLVRPRTARDEDKALLLTNGHCHPGGRPKPGEVITDKDVQIDGTVLSPAGRELGPLTGKVLYATMTGTDITLAQLDSTYADIQRMYKIEAFPLASSGPVPGQKIKVASSYLQSVWSCQAEAVIPTLKEGDYTSNKAIRYAKECNTQPGSSGSPVVNAETGELVAVNSTSNRDGKECELNNPCEVDSEGTVVHKGRGYATQTAAIAACIGSGNVVDLNLQGCTLPKP
ncbi:pimeloyl-ACP methyl ester carboxylesterase [Streptomyces sp. LBL]|uniref:alpha/beta fold hydrolase n=1 Tax=Streptomyces sp. LBL TaxID=2940562 RepID=UPI0024739C9D|nr:alpha/beta fold hydrolase [Streptomyces sp. LBL]MDH6625415.1 pimeloyl-ACP methyl ester carboxylesterase [Streptomyces sp. LBL]